jgi:hypothetical protein
MAHDGWVTAPQPTGRPNARLRQSVSDMVRSLAVVLIVVAAILLVTLRPKPDAVKPVDPATAVTLVTLQKEFAPLIPSGLPSSWVITSARFEPTAKSGGHPVFHLGYVTPSGQYAQVEESTAISAGFLDESTDHGAATGKIQIGGRTWQQWSSDKRNSLVNVDATHSVVISGTGGADELATLASSLQMPSPAPSN